jgi:hypothetical protein
MSRVILVAIGVFSGLEPAKAYEAPSCAVIETGSVYWAVFVGY